MDGQCLNHYLPEGSAGLISNLKTSKMQVKGYLLEVDVHYPKELHNSHNDLPFMCERMKINGVEKLIPNLY